MNVQDIFIVLQWWIILFAIGAVFFPLTSNIFSIFTDQGYAFSKIIGLIFISYLVFLLGFLKILPFSQLNILIITLCFAIGTLFWFKIKQIKISTFLKGIRLELLIFEELLFLLTLFLWTYVRGNNPEIYGLEKYMDFGFINSILRSTYFPPKDMWYPPFPINYYYFGHLITAVITKLSSLPSLITYNLMIASLFALSFIESFSIGLQLLSNLVKSHISRLIVGALLIAGLVTLAGNLHVIYSFFKPYENDKPVPPWELQLSIINPCIFQKSYITTDADGKKTTVYCTAVDKKELFLAPNSYWYPNATRFIYHTIHEFPIYSWVVADLHGHVLDIPIVLLTIALLLSLFTNNNKPLQHLTINQKIKSKIKCLLNDKWKMINGKYILLGFLIAVMFMTNAWDGMTYFMLATFTIIYIVYKNTYSNEHITKKGESNHKFFYYKLSLFIYNFIFYMLILTLSFFIFSRPFAVNFDASKIVGGIGVLCAPDFIFHKTMVNGNANYETIKIGPFLLEPNHCQKSPEWQLLILYGFFYFFVSAFFVLLWKKKKLHNYDVFIILLIITATILIIIPEFLYMKDIYPDHYRANTMFKLVFQSFIMLSIASGYIIIRTIPIKEYLFKRIWVRFLYFIYLLVTILILSLVFIYPYFATKSYYNNLKQYIGLDGLAYLKSRSLGDYEAVFWLNNNVTGQPTILEAQGDSYTDYERISANTGLPTVLGWYVHEWLWRGEAIPKPRADDTRLLYESTDINQTKNLINKYDIRYVIIGSLESQKYLNLDEKKFSSLGKIVFSSGGTKIYKIY